MKRPASLQGITVLLKGGGEVGTAVAHRLACCHFRVVIAEVANPLAVTREAAFCEAAYEGHKAVEGVIARLVDSPESFPQIWEVGEIPVIIDPTASIRQSLDPQVLVDAIMAKRNTGTHLQDAPLVIGLGPGFVAGRDVHAIVETNNSNNLGRVILKGEAEADTGIPIPVGGYTYSRVSHPPVDGLFTSEKRIGMAVKHGDILGWVEGQVIRAEIDGILRGLLRSGVRVTRKTKLAEIDPLARPEDCSRIRALPRAIAGGVLEALLYHLNTPSA